MRDQQPHLRSAKELEELAFDLAHQKVRGEVAIEALLAAAGGNLSALRRAHRHSERELIERWPAPVQLTRAFFLLSAARNKAEVERD